MQENTEEEAYFNPRLREGGDVLPSIRKTGGYQFQSTPPRRRRQGQVSGTVYDIYISIHASAKEATGLLELFRLGVENFNPRLREGGDA